MINFIGVCVCVCKAFIPEAKLYCIAQPWSEWRREARDGRKREMVERRSESEVANGERAS